MVHRVRDIPGGGFRIWLEFEYRRIFCHRCKAVKRETLAWLATGALFTKRAEDNIGRQCRTQTIKQVAEYNHIGWAQAQRMAIAYMKRVVAANPISPDLRAIGIDEISVRKRHKYRITVSDLDAKRPIWMGGDGRSEEDIEKFFVEIGPERCAKIQIVVMDMWKPFRKIAKKYVPNARIIFDKFHIIRHLADALDEVRRQEYKRVSDKSETTLKASVIRCCRTRPISMRKADVLYKCF